MIQVRNIFHKATLRLLNMEYLPSICEEERSNVKTGEGNGEGGKNPAGGSE